MEAEMEEYDNNDLDFYDFLEMIADKIDSVTLQSTEENVQYCFLFHRKFYLFIVEERKEDSRQRWQRKKEEVEEQKRLLKTQLENHIHLLSESFKKPNFIRIRDKITFTIGVANACFSPLIGNRH